MTDELEFCDHKHTIFVCSGRSLESRHEVRVCAECGRVFVTADKGGQAMKVSFHIHNRETLEPMVQWVDYVEANE